MKAGEKFDASTNSELLNAILGTDYKGYQYAIRKISDDNYIWMISLDGEKRYGWVHTFLENTIVEDYVDGEPYPNNVSTGLNYKKRLVFDKVRKDGKTLYYVFRGVYELTNKGTYTHRIFEKVSDETDLIEMIS